MKTLTMFQQDDEIVLQRMNEFSAVFEKRFDTLSEFLSYLETYKLFDQWKKYQIGGDEGLLQAAVEFLESDEVLPEPVEATITMTLREFKKLEGYQIMLFDLHKKLSSAVINEIYNDDLDVNEHEFDVQKLQEIALDHYHDC
ncbi:hypothetical protein [Jeotgalibacillus malaysiensis]|uniref:hypothetical protein n=1 Tax=Jeotgalibacillus malaysiensis TaxID=1508404 RepID=UPI00384F0F77